MATSSAVVARRPQSRFKYALFSLLGLMFFLWVVILHAPRVAASPHNGNEWTSAFVALAMSGSALLVAGTLARRD